MDDHMESGPASASWRLDALFVRGAKRRRIIAAIHAGRLREVARMELLAPAQLRGLAQMGLILLMASGAVFLALQTIARSVQHVPLLPGSGSPLVVLGLIAGNLLAYAAILPLHEGVHALIILLLGGRPTFGLKLPLAAYCTAPGQLFTRNGYAAVALAPLILLSLAGIVLIWLAPNVAAYTLFGLAGNVSGAVGDLAAARRALALPPDALIADTATGFIAYVADGSPSRAPEPAE